MKYAAHYKKCYHHEHGVSWSWKALNMTGRWKIVTDPDDDEYKMFIEHKALIFKYWIHEDFIEIRPLRTDVIMKCGLN